MSLIGDAATVCLDARDPAKWLPAIREMVTLSPSVFSAEAHAVNLRDIAAALLSLLTSGASLLPSDTGACQFNHSK